MLNDSGIEKSISHKENMIMVRPQTFLIKIWNDFFIIT